MSQLRSRLPELELRWLGGRRGLEQDIVPAADIRLERLWLRSLRTVDASLNTILDPLRLAASLPHALWQLIRWRPDVVYATGGYVAIPVLAAATLLRIPSLIWEGNRVPGRSVRLSGRMATLRTVSFAGARDELPRPTLLTGTPIRALAGGDRDAARTRLGLSDDVPVLLVFGGSQAVRRLNEAIADAAADLVERCYLIHIAGAAAIDEAETLRATLRHERRERYRPYAYLHDDMDATLTAADLLVGRAGSSTLAEAAAAGLPMIVVPYPHAAAHQRANAAEMVEAGAAVLVDDEDLDGDALRDACDLLFDERLAEMSGAARRIGRPGAAAVSASLLEALVTGGAIPDDVELDRLTREAGG